MALFTGSENNSLYMYYKGLPKQLMTYKFDTVRSVLVSVVLVVSTSLYRERECRLSNGQPSLVCCCFWGGMLPEKKSLTGGERVLK